MGLVTAARKEGSMHHPMLLQDGNSPTSLSGGDCAVSASVPLTLSSNNNKHGDDDAAQHHNTIDVPLRSSRSSALGVLGFFAGSGGGGDRVVSDVGSSSHTSSWGSVDNLYVAMGLMGSLTKDVDALVGECHQLSSKFDEEVAKFGVEIGASNVVVGLGGGHHIDEEYVDTEDEYESSFSDDDGEDNNTSPQQPIKKVRLEFTPDLYDLPPSEVMRAAVSAYKALLITASMLRRVVIHTLRTDLETVGGGGGGGIDAVGMYESVVPSEERYLIGDITRAVRAQFATLLHQQIAAAAAATTLDNDQGRSDNDVVMSLLSSYVGKYTRICVDRAPPANQLSEAFLDVADALEVRWVCDGVSHKYLWPTVA